MATRVPASVWTVILVWVPMNATWLVRAFTTAGDRAPSGGAAPIETDSGRTISLTGPFGGVDGTRVGRIVPFDSWNAGAPPPLVTLPSRKFDSPMKSATNRSTGRR